VTHKEILDELRQPVKDLRYEPLADFPCERGRHRTNLDTLSRIARALDMRMVVGFETTTSGGRTQRDLVAF
jgi:uncharacterized protein YlaI